MAGEATLLIQLEATNSVTSVAIFSERLAGITLSAGEQTRVCVLVQTEDGIPLPHATAEEGLVLRLLPPGGGRDSALTCTPSQVRLYPCSRLLGMFCSDSYNDRLNVVRLLLMQILC